MVVLGAPNDNDLDVGGLPSVTPPPGAPVFTSSRLSDLPNCLHFRHLMVSCRQEHNPQRVVKCSATLENLISPATRMIQFFSFRAYANIFARVEDGRLLFPIDPSKRQVLKMLSSGT